MHCDQVQCLDDINLCVNKILDKGPCSVSAEQAMDLKLCLYELLGNAIRHRHYNDGPNISVCWMIKPEGVAIDIHSDGEAGPLKNYSRAILTDACLLDESGRGLFIVASIAESLYYSEDFRHIRLTLSW